MVLLVLLLMMLLMMVVLVLVLILILCWHHIHGEGVLGGVDDTGVDSGVGIGGYHRTG